MITSRLYIGFQNPWIWLLSNSLKTVERFRGLSYAGVYDVSGRRVGNTKKKGILKKVLIL